MKTINLIFSLLFSICSYSQEGVTLTSFNDNLDEVIATDGFNGTFTFGVLDTNVLKWEGTTYDGEGYQEFFFDIVSVEQFEDKAEYQLIRLNDEAETKITFFGNKVMVLIEQFDTAPLVLSGDVKY